MQTNPQFPGNGVFGNFAPELAANVTFREVLKSATVSFGERVSILRMVRSGFDPTRRSRNIGTERQGHGANNRLTMRPPSATLCCHPVQLNAATFDDH